MYFSNIQIKKKKKKERKKKKKKKERKIDLPARPILGQKGKQTIIFLGLIRNSLGHRIWQVRQGFFPGGDWGSPIQRKFCQSPPSDTCPRFWTKACPPPAEVRPPKFEKFKYIFVSNLTTFKLKSTLKSCISCLK